MNYYNDNDAYAAQWLCNLVDADEIPPGHVDDRSIEEVEPDDLEGYTQHHFFAGVGGWCYALRLAGWPEDRPVWTGSPPCQPLSSAGQRRGDADKRHLWPAFYRLIAKCRPATIIGEQVASKDGREWLAAVRADMERLGYACGAADLPAASVGAPHIRQRLFWLAHTEDAGMGRGIQSEERLQARHGGRLANNTGEGCNPKGIPGQALPGPQAVQRSDRLRGPGRLAHSQRPDRRQESRHGGTEGEHLHIPEREESSIRPGTRGQDSRMAYAQRDGAGGGGREGQPCERGDGEAVHELGTDGASRIGMADPGCAGHESGRRPGQAYGEVGEAAREAQQRQWGGPDIGNSGEDCRLAHPNGGRPQPRRLSVRQTRQDEAPAEQLGADDRMGDPTSKGLEGRKDIPGDTRQELSPAERTGAWGDIQWLPCADGRARPTQPGLHPLAYGVPARAPKLRAYGNAIVPHVAALFVSAYMDVLEESCLST